MKAILILLVILLSSCSAPPAHSKAELESLRETIATYNEAEALNSKIEIALADSSRIESLRNKYAFNSFSNDSSFSDNERDIDWDSDDLIDNLKLVGTYKNTELLIDFDAYGTGFVIWYDENKMECFSYTLRENTVELTFKNHEESYDFQIEAHKDTARKDCNYYTLSLPKLSNKTLYQMWVEYYGDDQ